MKALVAFLLGTPEDDMGRVLGPYLNSFLKTGPFVMNPLCHAIILDYGFWGTQIYVEAIESEFFSLKI